MARMMNKTAMMMMMMMIKLIMNRMSKMTDLMIKMMMMVIMITIINKQLGRDICKLEINTIRLYKEGLSNSSSSSSNNREVLFQSFIQKFRKRR